MNSTTASCLRSIQLFKGAYALLILGLTCFISTGNAGSHLATCVTPPTGMIAWWTGDGNAVDLIGTNSGVLMGSAGYGVGLTGEAFSFDGSGYVQMPNSDLWAFGTNDFTIELWANWSVVNGSDLYHPDTVFIANDETANNHNKWVFDRSGGTLNFHVNSPSLGPIFVAQYPFTPATHTWYHLAVTRTSLTFRIYVNGVLASTEFNAADIPNPNAPLTIGVAEGLGYMNGLIDEVSIYNRALAGVELQANYAAGAEGKCRPPLPQLTIAQVTNTARIQWPPSAVGFTLESTSTLVPASWFPVTNAVQVVSNQNTVSIAAPSNNQFFRLRK